MVESMKKFKHCEPETEQDWLRTLAEESAGTDTTLAQETKVAAKDQKS